MTDRTSLASECHDLRVQLKEWERAFAENNLGQKPGKGDIKNTAEIAAKYRIYNRKRDVLDGKKDISTLKQASPAAGKPKSPSSKFSLRDFGPKPPQTPFATPRKVLRSLPETHLGILGFYDAPPASQSPHRLLFKNAIGPTPQRDGKILGLFDCISNAGSGPSPSSRKRKAHQFDEQHDGIGLLQTPSKKVAVVEAASTPNSISEMEGRRRSRTPASDGKRFMLSQFFATPSAGRFWTGAESESSPAGQREIYRTPLRDKVMGQRKDVQAEVENPCDTTPAFLKRSTSFNQRLLGASSLTKRPFDSKTRMDLVGSTKVSKVPSLRPIQGKPLSEILRGLRHMNDDEDEDGMDALREMEGNEVNGLVGDSQAVTKSSEVNQQPARIWKKRGQKRTTRRIIMRPAAVQRTKRDKESYEHGDDRDYEAEAVSVEWDEAHVEETQLVGRLQQGSTFVDEVEGDLLPIAASEEKDTTRTGNNAAKEKKSIKSTYSSPCLDSEADELAMAHTNAKSHEDPNTNKPQTKRKSKEGKSKEGKRVKDSQDGKMAETRSGKRLNEGRKADKEKKMRKGTNPNAPSNMNFRSLKIRSRNSKAKGGGSQHRFGKGRR